MITNVNTDRCIYPFSGIVGQEDMVLALILNAINPRIGGVLIQGERGTAKSTAVRALAALLPKIQVIRDCRFGCNPEKPSTWCSECHQRFLATEKPDMVERSTPFVNLPISATEDRVVGTLDIEKAIRSGTRAFDAGVLAEANRGLLYIDEVNLLDDHVVDVLLDVAAMGVNIIEREGISFSHPARFMLVGTMNPEEGTLRPQLIDRFGLSVNVKSITDIRRRILILQRVLDFENNPQRFMKTWENCEKTLSIRIVQARDLLPRMKITHENLEMIAEVTSQFKIEGHRADLVIQKTASAHAVFNKRTHLKAQDIQVAAQLALPHRLKRKPFDQPLEIPALEETVQTIVYPERAARLQDILNDKRDPATIQDLANECGFYIVG
ncbi:MAG: ATP-binding protein [Anaerolineaceae bacterium]|nr:ATP-binding protein [Anaerolineaceae bacterium]